MNQRQAQMIAFKGSDEWKGVLDSIDREIEDAKEEISAIQTTLSMEEIGREVVEALLKVKHYKGFKENLEVYIQQQIQE